MTLLSCRDCKKPVSSNAAACPHCGCPVNPQANKPGAIGGSITPFADEDEEESIPEEPVADYATLLLGIPVAAIMLVIFWVGNMSLIQSPVSTLQLILISTVLATASFSALECSKNGSPDDIKEGMFSPTGWFFVIVLLWIVAFPIYLYKRSHYGLRNFAFTGTFLVFLFVICWGFMYSVVEDRVSELRGKIDQLHHQFNR